MRIESGVSPGFAANFNPTVISIIAVVDQIHVPCILENVSILRLISEKPARKPRDPLSAFGGRKGYLALRSGRYGANTGARSGVAL